MPDSPESTVFRTVLEEYKIQRVAASEKLKTAQQTVTFGATTVGILIAGGFNVWRDVLPATLIFLVIVPLVSAAVVVQWVGQMRSFGRTHAYINALEDAMLQELSSEGGSVPPVLFLKSTPKSQKWYYPDERWFQSAAIVVFGLLAAGSLGVGAYRGSDRYGALVLAVGTSEFVGLAAVAVLLLWALARPKAREEWARSRARRRSERRK